MRPAPEVVSVVTERCCSINGKFFSNLSGLMVNVGSFAPLARASSSTGDSPFRCPPRLAPALEGA
jgi:hypothetical protein